MSGPSVSGAGATTATATSPPDCRCWAATCRIANLYQSQESSSGETTTTTTTSSRGWASSLPDTLNMERDLVQHWAMLNGCEHSDSHICTTQTLSCMADAIVTVLRNHELAIDALSRSLSSLQTTTQSTPPAADMMTGWSSPRTFVGSLELDPAESAIVAQEALKRSLVRLGAVLQDMEEEAVMQGSSETTEFPLRGRDTKELIARLLRLLGTVDGLEILSS